MQKLLKHFFVVLFAILYVVPAVGLSFDLHKCGKKVKVIAVNDPHGAKCPCGTDMPMDCCADVHLDVKLGDAQQNSKSVLVCQKSCLKPIILPVQYTIGEVSGLLLQPDFSFYHAPPFKWKQPVYLLNSIFRI